MTAISERRSFIGGSEVAALFGVHPRKTEWQLWHEKAGNIPEPDLSDNERVQAGLALEDGIAMLVARQQGWRLKKGGWTKHPSVEGMAATLDYEITDHPDGPGCLEIKNVDGIVFAQTWGEDEPPLYIILQLQHQLACTGYAWGCVAALVGGNRLIPYLFKRHAGTVAKLERSVTDFWQSIAEEREPKPDFTADGAAIAQLYADVTEGRCVDLTGDNRVPELCAEYAAAAAAEKDAKARKEAAKAELLLKLGDAERATCGDYTISAKAVAAKSVAYTRKSYRNFRITERKTEEKEAA